MGKDRKPVRRPESAKDLYLLQNTILHKAFSKIGYPYEQNKDLWMDVCAKLFNRRVNSLKTLCLYERYRLIGHLKSKGCDVTNPFVPKHVSAWKITDDKDIKVKPDARPSGKALSQPGKSKMMSKIEAFILEAGRPWEYVHSMAKRMYGVDRIEWCTPDQLHAIIAALAYDAKRHNRRTS